MLNQVLVDMKTQLVEAKKQVAVAIGDEKRLKKQWDEQVAQGKEWERKAMLAVQAGDDELAKEALFRQKEHDELSLQFEQQWVSQKDAVDKLKVQLRILTNKIEEAKRKRNIASVTSKSVSYTHLDVYKRQVHRRKSAQSPDCRAAFARASALALSARRSRRACSHALDPQAPPC